MIEDLPPVYLLSVQDQEPEKAISIPKVSDTFARSDFKIPWIHSTSDKKTHGDIRRG